MSRMDEIEKKMKEAAGGMFISLKNEGDKTMGAFVGEPELRYTSYDDVTKVYTKVSAEAVAGGQKASARVAINFFVPAENKMRALELNQASFKNFSAAYKKYGIESCMYEVIRQGAKGDTKACFTILRDRDITDEDRAAIKSHPLNDLTQSVEEKSDADSFDKKDEKKPAAAPTAKSAPAAAPAASAMISEEEAQALLVRIKALPIEKRDAFKANFGGKVREIPASKVAAVKLFVDECEGKKAAPPPPPADADDFAD